MPVKGEALFRRQASGNTAVFNYTKNPVELPIFQAFKDAPGGITAV